MDREAWQAIVHRITKNRTWLSNWACMQEWYFLRMIREGGWWNCILKDLRMWIWVQHLSLPSQRWAQEAKMMPFTCRFYHKKSKHQWRIRYQERRSFYRGKMQHHFLVEMSKKLIHIEYILTKKMCVCVHVCVCVWLGIGKGWLSCDLCGNEDPTKQRESPWLWILTNLFPPV